MTTFFTWEEGRSWVANVWKSMGTTLPWEGRPRERRSFKGVAKNNFSSRFRAVGWDRRHYCCHRRRRCSCTGNKHTTDPDLNNTHNHIPTADRARTPQFRSRTYERANWGGVRFSNTPRFARRSLRSEMASLGDGFARRWLRSAMGFARRSLRSSLGASYSWSSTVDTK